MSDLRILSAIVEAIHQAKYKARGRNPQGMVLYPEDRRLLYLELTGSWVRYGLTGESALGLPLIQSTAQRQGYVGFIFDEAIRLKAVEE